MSLSCLTCNVLRRTDSDNEQRGRFNNDENSLCLGRVDRSWSGNLAAPRPSSQKMTTLTSSDDSNHRHHNSGPMEFPSTPRLLRSPGVRRDWSFEDICRQMVED
uniref:Pollen-specific small CDPK-interacting protein 1 n=1 Tax=Petunia integrifolia subsp. inflata TaxID=212142 RepID=M4T2L5_PETIN|nr:pollen-specific small CDPK-interacting protein 1 [Petunia integrifolia subsp. inflata]